MLFVNELNNCLTKLRLTLKKDEKIKKMCMDNINDKLVIINISTRIYGIRVIPETFYNPDPTLERQVMFADTS